VTHRLLLLTCGTLVVVILSIPRGNKSGPPRRDGSISPRRRCRLVLRRGQATAYRLTRRFQDDRAARGSAWRAASAAFDARPDAAEAGRNFYERAKQSIEAAEEAELAARGAAATLSGRLRICAPVTFTRLHVMPRLSTFLAEHPSLDIDVVLKDRDIDLIQAGIDVALRIDRLPDQP
jgi:LysR substrate binding domain